MAKKGHDVDHTPKFTHEVIALPEFVFNSLKAHFSCLLFKCSLIFSSSDVDECVTNMHNCDDNAMCINTVGSFHCMCNMGYSGIGTEGNCTSKISAVQSVIHLPVTPVQLMKPSIGQNMSCAMVTLHKF